MKRSDSETLYIQFKTKETFVLVSGAYSIEHTLDIQTGNVRDSMEDPEIITFDRDGALILAVDPERSTPVPDWLQHQLPANQLLTNRYPTRFRAAYWGRLLLFVRDPSGQSYTLTMKDWLLARATNGRDDFWLIGGGDGRYDKGTKTYRYHTQDSRSISLMATLQLEGANQDHLWIVDLALDDVQP